MTTRASLRRLPLWLAGLSLVIAFVQRPGVVVADTKVNLYVDPIRFLGDVISAWTPTGSVGHVFSGQYGGYLWPMGPFFALGHEALIPTWITQRLWLAALTAIGAWGIVRLLDDLWTPRRGVAHVVAGVLFVVNPYVAVYDDRTSVTLLGYAALPWLLVAVHRGLRNPRGWAWPVAFALIVTSAGGGVNATVVAFMLLGPALLLVYELLYGGVPRAAVWPWLARLVPLTVLASAWWVVGVAVNSAYGLNFLPYTEQPGTVWDTTSITEALRLMGFWTSYFGFGFDGVKRPFTSDGAVLLFGPLVVVASLLVPALALLGLAWTRKRRYAPFFLLMVFVGLLVVTAGFPNGTPLRRGLDFTYSHVVAVQFLRTSYKAAPLIALGIACLAGLGADELWQRLPRGLSWSRLVRPALALGAAGLVALAAWPLVRGEALDAQLELPHGVPAAWTETAHEIDRNLPANDRAMILPGQLFAYYKWGGTVDAILPALTSRPVAVRTTTPYADLRAVDLQWSVDDLISQQRAYPGQLAPLLDLLGVGQVVSATDDDLTRSGGPQPGDAAIALAQQGLGPPAHAYGPVAPAPVSAGSLATPPLEPQVRTYNTYTGGIVRVLPQTPETIVDGDAGSILDLAALGSLDPSQPLRYAADLTPPELRAAAAAGASLVVSDSNRRQIFVASRMQANRGPTLGPSDPISVDSAVLNPFPSAGTSAQTVEDLSGGVAYVNAPYSPGFSQFPEHRPFAAIDGNLDTEWLADRALDPSRWYLDVGFTHPRDVPYVDLYPYDDVHGTVTEVNINGRSFAVHAGDNHLVLDLRGVSALRVLLAHVAVPANEKGSAGGISELQIPGIHARETLRTPVDLEDALAGTNLEHASLSYLFSRTTGDDPLAREPFGGPAGAGLVRDEGDGETVLARTFTPPAARSWTADGWVQVAADAPDPFLDRLAGYRGPLIFTSSSRFDGQAQYRASSAFASGGPGWIGEWLAGHPAWLAWSAPHELTISRLRLVPQAIAIRRPTSVRLVYDGGATGPLAVAANGTVALPGTLRSRSFRLDILAASFPAGTSGFDRQRRAVGIARVVGVEGLGPVDIPRSGPLAGGCDGPTFTVGGHTITLRPSGTVQALDAGQALRAYSCAGAVSLSPVTQTLQGIPGPLLVDLLRLRSAAPVALAAATGQGGAVLDPGKINDGSVTGVRVHVTGPAWLVLGEGYDRGWEASCDGHSLGAPVPLQGFANGWPVSRGCTDVTFTFAPNRWLVAADVLSGLVALAMLVGLAAAAVLRRRGRRPGPARAAAAPWPDFAPPEPTPWPLRRAIVAGVAWGCVIAFCFALRAGVVAGPLIALALWRGVGARWLVLASGGLLVIVVPLLYLVIPGKNHGGYDSNYAIDHIAAHWVGLAAMVGLAFALYRTLAGARAGRAASPGPAPGDVSTATDRDDDRGREPAVAGGRG